MNKAQLLRLRSEIYDKHTVACEVLSRRWETISEKRVTESVQRYDNACIIVCRMKLKEPIPIEL
jgi:hypothetical protein